MSIQTAVTQNPTPPSTRTATLGTIRSATQKCGNHTNSVTDKLHQHHIAISSSNSDSNDCFKTRAKSAAAAWCPCGNGCLVAVVVVRTSLGQSLYQWGNIVWECVDWDVRQNVRSPQLQPRWCRVALECWSLWYAMSDNRQHFGRGSNHSNCRRHRYQSICFLCVLPNNGYTGGKF